MPILWLLHALFSIFPNLTGLIRGSLVKKMKNHILIKHAKRKPYSKHPSMPADAVFDNKKGYWVSGSTPLVSPGSKYGALVSKKCDQETGEDQKGE